MINWISLKLKVPSSKIIIKKMVSNPGTGKIICPTHKMEKGFVPEYIKNSYKSVIKIQRSKKDM